MNWVNKDTEIYCSFAKTAGNTGCRMMNTAFYYYGMNKIYKSFSINNIKDGLSAVKTLNIKGCGITMPFKKDVIEYVDECSIDVCNTGSANTIINNNGKLFAHNTDVFSSFELLRTSFDYFSWDLYILGNGGFASSVKYSAEQLFKNVKTITRDNWNKIKNIKNSVIFNCTPVIDIDVSSSNKFIDCIVGTETGNKLANLQASKQFELYTGQKWPMMNG